METDTLAPDPLYEVNDPLRVYFIRHGETAWSLSGQHTGRTDLPLTPQGESMARGLATTLAGLGAAAQVEPSLAEWDYGDYEGLRTAEIREQHPGWDVWADGCPHGEMPAEVSARADQLTPRLQALAGKVALSQVIALWNAAAKLSP